MYVLVASCEYGSEMESLSGGYYMNICGGSTSNVVYKGCSPSL
jgi:hypothetical protein